MNALLKDLPAAPLSPEAEQAALASGDHETIVLHTLPQAFNYCKNVSRGKLQDPEIFSLAYAALSKAVRRFSPGKGRFLAYAKSYLRGEVCTTWRDRDVVRSSSRHEVFIENPKPPEEPRVEAAFEEIHWSELWKTVEPVIRETLTITELRVLEYRYKFGMTLQKTGDQIGKSRERVRQIEANALRKLRAALSSRGEL